MSQTDWPAYIASVIAREVRRHRDSRKMSARQLAERCAALGMEIPQPVIANLENGRRPTVSVAELLVLAAALDVPPALLVAPLGHQETTEILPGREMPTWDAVLWQAGEARLLDDKSGDQTEWLYPDDDNAVVALYHEHDRLISDWERLAGEAGDEWLLVTDESGKKLPVLTDAQGKVVLSADDYLDSLRGHADVIAEDLRELRTLMRQRDLLLPPVPEGLKDIDSGRPRRPRRPRRLPGQALAILCASRPGPTQSRSTAGLASIPSACLSAAGEP